jgi:hypothetical protein
MSAASCGPLCSFVSFLINAFSDDGDDVAITRDVGDSGRFVSGHDFSRADKGSKITTSTLPKARAQRRAERVGRSLRNRASGPTFAKNARGTLRIKT